MQKTRSRRKQTSPNLHQPSPPPAKKDSTEQSRGGATNEGGGRRGRRSRRRLVAGEGEGRKRIKGARIKKRWTLEGGRRGRVFIELFGARVVEWRNSRIQYRNFLFLPSKGQTFFFFCVRKKKKLFYLKKFLF